MGEVYRAHDATLDRDVALKILPDAFTADVDRVARFRREAQVLASLNHPNIAAIYGFVDSGKTQALVLELVEGPTLADRIAKGPIPLNDTLRIATQIAEALEAAHEKGIIHRDLKPANVKIRDDGAVKVLDFGLAKALEPASAVSPAPATAPTTTTPVQMTAAGVIRGTAPYMSPEQVGGRRTDRRTDIWAFGCIVFEMLTGRRAFAGNNVTEVFESVLTREPDWKSLPQGLSSVVETCLKLCLKKDPRQRFDSAQDMRLALEGAFDAAVTYTVLMPPDRPRKLPIAAAAVVGALLAAGTAATLWPKPTEIRGSFSLTVLPPPGAGSYSALTLSPDGRYLALRAFDAENKTARLWLRPLDSPSWQVLPETEGADSVAWAPDSRFLAFVADNKLRKIDVLGGPPQTIAEKATRWGASWSSQGTLVFNANGNGPLSRVSMAGGTASAATALELGEVRHQMPFFLPDGTHFLYGSFPSSIYVGSLGSGERKLLLKDVGLRSAYSRGHLFFERAGTLMAQQFDPARIELVGDPQAIAAIREGDAFDVSKNGVLAFRSGEKQRSQLQWLDRTGKSLGVVGGAANYYTVELSPDDRRAAGSMLRDSDRSSLIGDVWIFDLAGKDTTRLTFEPLRTVGRSVWSPDGRRIVFMRRGSKGSFDLFQKSSDGTGDEVAVLEDSVNKYPLSWSRDGRFLLYMAVPGTPTTGSDLWVLPFFGDRKPFPFLETRFSEVAGQVSPDGRWVAYYSNISGDKEVHVASFPDARVKRQISSGGRGGWPRWRGDGKEIYWLTLNELVAATVNGAGDQFEVSSIKTLFKVNPSGDGDSPFAVSADGQRFLIISAADEDSSTISLVTDVESRIH